MPHPFHPDDFPINQDVVLEPTKIFYLKGAIHFKTTARILDITDAVQEPFDDFSSGFVTAASQAAQKLDGQTPRYEISSSGNMMRTFKTMTNATSGERVCDLNITFVSFDCAVVRFPKGSAHSRHDLELWPVDAEGERAGTSGKHEAFVKNSVPYFWDFTSGPDGVLYKCLNQTRIEIARVAGYGFAKDAILALNAAELDDAAALATCVILLNGRDAMDP
ncbi:hypothetical protein F4779DRAFT_161760 [Xylariaceae sp. FL0662B]|nr:hypothetical protein F4779DRAFT_161760 [Xylariaceae sp. FL0662B]